MSEKPEALRLADECEEGHPLEEDAKAAAAELRRLHAEVEALRADAGRYRCLRDSLGPNGKGHTAMPLVTVPGTNGAVTYLPDGLDATIDAVMEQTK